jgi:hypothetical protein
VPIESIERRFTISLYSRVGAGDVVNFANMTRLYLRAADRIADILLLGEEPDEEAVDLLLRRLEAGFPVSALDLMTLPVSPPRGEYWPSTGPATRRPTPCWRFPRMNSAGTSGDGGASDSLRRLGRDLGCQPLGVAVTSLLCGQQQLPQIFS